MPDLIPQFAQFGMAGLIAWMWLTERRHAQERERRLEEAHRLALEQRVHVEQLLRVVESNTRALTLVEAGQRRLAAALERARPLGLSHDDDARPGAGQA